MGLRLQHLAPGTRRPLKASGSDPGPNERLVIKHGPGERDAETAVSTCTSVSARGEGATCRGLRRRREGPGRHAGTPQGPPLATALGRDSGAGLSLWPLRCSLWGWLMSCSDQGLFCKKNKLRKQRSKNKQAESFKLKCSTQVLRALCKKKRRGQCQTPSLPSPSLLPPPSSSLPPPLHQDV